MRNFVRKQIFAFMVLIFSTSFAIAQNEFGGVIKFDKTIHDFGDILISDGEQKCKFTYTNISDKPMVVHKVISSCGCTEPTWEKKPLRPGERGTIDISFKNDQGPYPFDKGITVYVSDVPKPIVLRIRGVVHNKKKSLEELFPERFGQVGLKSKLLSLGQLEQGLAKNGSAEIVNHSTKPVTVTFKDITPGLYLSLDQAKIPPKGRAVLTYVVDSKRTKEVSWGSTVFSAKMVVNGTVQKGTLDVEVLIKENFSNLSSEQVKVGALPKFVSSSATIGKCKKGEVKKVVFSYSNIGKEPLRIYKVESTEQGCSFKYPEVVAPSAKGTIEVTIDTSKGTGDMMYVFSLITNAPTRPIINIFVTGEIEN